MELDEPLELTPDGRDPLLQLAGPLLHREPANTESDDLEVREKRVRGRRDHLALGTVGAKVGLTVLLAQHEVVVDRLRRDVHHREVDRPIRRRHVPPDRVDVSPHLLQERALLRAALRFVGGSRESVPRLVGELRVDRHNPARVADDRIDTRTVLVRVLDLIRGCRKRIV